MIINSNHCNIAFNKEIDKSREFIRLTISGVCGFTHELLVERMMQRIVEISLSPYATAVKNLCNDEKYSNNYPATGEKINCNQAYLEIGSGRVTLTLSQWLTNQFNFFKHWSFALFPIIFVKVTSNSNPATLVFGIAESDLFLDNIDIRFVNYCKNGPIEPLRNGHRFIIQSTLDHISSEPDKYEYSKRPLIEFLREAKLGFAGRLYLFIKHLFILFSYMVSAIRVPQLTLLGEDFAYSRILNELDKRRLIGSIILTCSNYTSQSISLRALQYAKVHMVWYAQNWSQLSFVSDNLKSDRPNLSWIRADTHWIWTNSFAKYIENLGIGKSFEVVGPIVWYMPETKPIQDTIIKIVIFDISPFSDEIALNIGQITNYHQPDNLFSFIDDIILLRNQLEKIFHTPVSFSLKTKRGYVGVYDKPYFEYIENLDIEGVISLEDHKTNLYSLISGSHLVIAYPFTSPAYIAEALKVPCIYYDPTQSIRQHDFADSESLIKFANSPKNLLETATSVLNMAIPVAS